MRSPTIWLGPVLLGLLVYFSIENYGPADGGYNRLIAGYMLVAASVLLLSSSLSGKTLRIERPSLIFIAALASSVTISAFGAADVYVSVNRLHLYFAAVALGVAFYVWQLRDARPTIATYFAIIALVHAYFLVQVFFWLLSVQSESNLPMHRMPHYANIRHFAYHGFIAAASATVWFMIARRLEVTSLVLTSAALFGIVLLGARGAFLAWLACIALLLLFFGKDRVRLMVFSLIAATTSVGLVYYLTSTGAVRAPTLIQRVGAGMEDTFYAADRLAIWTDSIRAIIKQPLFGYGPEGYILSQCCNPSVAQPHNFLLQFLLEVGMIGTGLMLLGCWYVIRSPERRRIIGDSAPDPGTLGLLAVLLSFLGYASIDGLLYHAIPIIHFAVFSALFLATTKFGDHAGVSRY